MIENLKELWKYRALIVALTTRHLAMRYRGSALGFFWSILNPLMLMAVYTLVFRYYVRFDAVENYSIFLFCGLLPWIWTQGSLVEATGSISSSGHLITKSMFPAHILPFVALLTGLANFILSLPVLFIFMLVAGVPFQMTLLWLPFLLVLQFLFLIGPGFLLSAFNVQFRDVQHLIANLLTLLFFLTPILYPREAVPEKFRITLDMNPLAVLTNAYHGVFLGEPMPGIGSFLYLILFSVLLFWIGNKVFQNRREAFAEYL